LQSLYEGLEERSPGAGDKFCALIDRDLELLRAFPNRARRVPGHPRLRRLLIGKHREYGLYYSVEGRRVVIAALISQRLGPELIRWRFSE
jgi:plasmid stabilization system protein ParE